MKKLLLIISTAILLFTSCAEHIYLTKSTPDISWNIGNNDSTYVFENDTVRITYYFWCIRGKCKFEVYNKLNVPLFIDWKNSALIINNEANNYWKDETVSKSSTYGVYGKGYYGSSSNGSSVHIDRLSDIPAHSQITKVHDKFFTDHTYPTDEDYNKHIRNYIAYSTYEDFHNESFIDVDFEVVDIIKTHNLNKYRDNRYFYLAQ